MGNPFADRFGCAGVAEFRVNRLWYDHAIEQARQQIDFADENQVAERPGVSDDDGHAVSQSKPVKHLALTIQILGRVGFENLVCFQEAVDLVTGLEAKQLPQVRLGQTSGTVFLGGQRFERAAREIGAIGGEAGGDVVGEGNGQVHAASLTERDPDVKSRMIKDVGLNRFAVVL